MSFLDQRLLRIDLAAAAAGASRCFEWGGVASTGRPVLSIDSTHVPRGHDFGSAILHKMPMPALLEHDPGRVAGAVQAIESRGGKLILCGVVWHPEILAFRGRPKLSLGWGDSGAGEYVAEADSAALNGRCWQGPFRLCRGSRLFEVSFCLDLPAADSDTWADVGSEVAAPDLTTTQESIPLTCRW